MNISEQFNHKLFIEWVENFLPDFSIDLRNVDIPKTFSNVKKIETVGESSIGVRVYIIETESDPSKRKVGLTTESFSLLKNYGTPNALIAYYSNESPNWRISLLTSTPVWNDGKIITKLSNPKRQSYVIGPKAKINTPYKFLITQGKVLDFDNLKSRFSLEVVNKEFYKEISKEFTKLSTGLLKLPSVAEKSQTNLEFAVRLIGRIIFCWFLREKRSESGMALMPKELLSVKATQDYKEYYHNILEPIFFEVLNKPIRSRREEYAKAPFSFVPYLNGGLFSPQEDDFYRRMTNEIQSQYHNTLIVPDSWIHSFFEILETYNFTIDENTSYDEELSIDPEMLGRIFENLLAEINPETGESARKSTGSYYTPRVIVNYMVDKSLLLYLKEQTGIKEDKLRALISYDLNDDEDNAINLYEREKIIEALERLKILDPACGSGAFPIGTLQKIVFILQQVDPEGSIWKKQQLSKADPEFKRDIENRFSKNEIDFLRKLSIIRKSIFGIDIQPIATEISRLRCFLTLIVDESINDHEENRGIKPLPNLDFKFVTANSLIGLPKIDLSQQSIFDDYQKIDDLKYIRDQYFNASGLEREQLKTEFVMQQKRLVDQLIKEHGFMGVAKAELTQKLTDWEPFTHKSTSWFDPEWMFGIKDGFDVIIANPPYVGEKGHKLTFDNLRKTTLGKTFNKGKMDIFYYFFHFGLDNLKQKGILSFITTNYYPTADGAIKLRKDFYERSNVIELINFNEYKIFESALGQHNMITILQRNTPLNDFVTLQTYVNKNGGPDSTELANILTRISPDGLYTQITRSKLFDGNSFYIRFASNDNKTDILLDKLVNSGTHLKEFAITNEGLHTGLDTISDKDLKKLNSHEIFKGDGVFVLPKGLFKFNHLKPWYKGSDINHYIANTSTNSQVLYYDNQIIPDEEELKHLMKYKKLLENRVAIKRADRPWHQLNWPREKDMFEGQKIVNPYRSKENYFALVDVPWYASADVFYTRTKNSDVLSNIVLTAILNSKLILFWLSHRGKRKGKILEMKSIPIGQIPIILPNLEQKKELTRLINKIMELKKDDINANIKNLESEINSIVYNVYGLTEEEIKIVESSV